MIRGIVVAVALSVIGFGAENVNYDAARQGQLPAGWTGHPKSKWEVRADKTAPSHPNVFLGATAESDSPAVFDKIVCRDGDLSVKFRIAAGQRGNAAGVIWRYQDAGNYYLLTLSAEDNKIVLQRVRNGVAEVIPATGGKSATVDIKTGQWHVVKVIFRGPNVRVLFGNRGLFEAQDSGNLNAGKTGLWVKGANGAAFDDFRIDKKG